MMMAATRSAFYAIDRIESTGAWLVDDDGRRIRIAIAWLPRGCRVGSVIRVELEAGGEPAWETAIVDLEEQQRRSDAARTTLEKLKRTRRSRRHPDAEG